MTDASGWCTWSCSVDMKDLFPPPSNHVHNMRNPSPRILFGVVVIGFEVLFWLPRTITILQKGSKSMAPGQRVTAYGNALAI